MIPPCTMRACVDVKTRAVTFGRATKKAFAGRWKLEPKTLGRVASSS
jgi:hypothetical protein